MEKNMNGIRFNASWERRLSVISSLTTLILVLVVLETIAKASLFDSGTIALRIGLVIFVGITSALFFIRGYSITTDAVHILHFGWATSLKIKNLTGVEKVPLGATSGIGLFGIWGIYSFTGIARNSTYGIHRRYLTNRFHAVALKFGKKTVVVSPDDPEAFIKLLRSYLEQKRA
jgi:hypothetical protein